MSKFIVHLVGDEEEYEFHDREAALDFIDESPSGGELIEVLSLDALNADLI